MFFKIRRQLATRKLKKYIFNCDKYRFGDDVDPEEDEIWDADSDHEFEKFESESRALHGDVVFESLVEE